MKLSALLGGVDERRLRHEHAGGEGQEGAPPAVTLHRFTHKQDGQQILIDTAEIVLR